MEDKIVEVFKKYSKSVDTEYNVYNCLIEENWSNIAQELVKLFRQPAVSGSFDHEIIEKVRKSSSDAEARRHLQSHIQNCH